MAKEGLTTPSNARRDDNDEPHAALILEDRDDLRSHLEWRRQPWARWKTLPSVQIEGAMIYLV
jgi:hypothetical protein